MGRSAQPLTELFFPLLSLPFSPIWSGVVKQTNKTRSASSYFFQNYFGPSFELKPRIWNLYLLVFFLFFFFFLLTVPPWANGELATPHLSEYGLREGGGGGKEGTHSSTVYHNILAKGNQL